MRKLPDEVVERGAQALYEHWVEEDFANEYAPWAQLGDKDTWRSRCRAALSAIAPKDEAMLAEKDRLDHVSLEQNFTNDPVERLVGEALTSGGFEWRHEGHPKRRNDPVTLDFEIVGGPHVEVKRFHTARVESQLAQVENVILIQGIEAARWFAALLAPKCSPIPLRLSEAAEGRPD